MKRLVTKRLTLQEAQKENLQQVFEIWSDSEAGKYMFDTHWASADELAVILEGGENYFSFVALLPDSDDVVATCRISSERTDGEWDIGYNVHKDHWGKGFATEMVKGLLSFAKELEATSVVASVAQANVASCKVLEKCGFVIDGESSFTKKSTDIVYACNNYRFIIV